MVEEIYRRPLDYDLEHGGEEMPDIPFSVELARRYAARHVLELASGTGRLTLPLARAGAAGGWTVAGLELVPQMLDVARRKAAREAPSVRAALQLCRGDMRRLGEVWPGEHVFDLALLPFGSAYHLLTLADQLATWRGVYRLLTPGGHFVVDLYPPDLHELAGDGGAAEPHLEREVCSGGTQERLRRFKSTRYHADEQLAEVHYVYEKYQGSALVHRYESDFPMHVYYPRELHLLFLYTGFAMEGLFGSYDFAPFGPAATNMIAVGRRPA